MYCSFCVLCAGHSRLGVFRHNHTDTQTPDSYVVPHNLLKIHTEPHARILSHSHQIPARILRDSEQIPVRTLPACDDTIQNGFLPKSCQAPARYLSESCQILTRFLPDSYHVPRRCLPGSHQVSKRNLQAYSHNLTSLLAYSH